MLVKRLLLLPGKGDVIICIFVLFNVLLSGEPAGSVEIAGFSGSWNTASAMSSLPSVNSAISLFLLRFLLVTQLNLVNLPFSMKCAAEAVLIQQDQIQMPVLNKTDPLLMIGVSIGGKVNNSQDNSDSNYNKRRRTPVSNHFVNNLNNSFSANISSQNLSKISLVDTSLNGGISDNKTINVRTTNKVSPLEGKSGNGSLTKRKTRRKTRTYSNHTGVPRRKARQPKLLKEITLFNRQNCLAKLLCGVQVAQPPTKSSSALNDYAYLVKAFFDRFSIRGIVTDVIDTAFAYEQDALELLDDEADDEEEDDTSSEKRKKKRKKAPGPLSPVAHRPRRPTYENYKTKYYDEYDKDLEDVDLDEIVDSVDDLPDFMEPDLLIRRQGHSMVHVKPFHTCGPGKNGSESGARLKHRPKDINKIRRKRGISGEVKRGFMGFFNPRFDKTAYLNKRQLELENTESKSRQLNIAEEIAARLRSPRQCRLLSWFGNNKNEAQNVNNPNGMTTTITTITNTGGMVGNMERLNGMQTLPQSAVTGNGGSGPGSQVVTVIQQSPLSAQNPGPTMATTSATTPGAAAKASIMFKNMGQSASSAMEQAGSVASHIGSTICPFNIQELQELILKAQTAPFPHFLTTTPTPPPRIVPAPIFPPASPQIYQPQSQFQPPVTTTSTLVTTAHTATQVPPPASSTITAGVGQNPQNPRNDPAVFLDMYGTYAPPPTPPRYQLATTPNSYYHYHQMATEAYPSPIYPKVYPTPYKIHQKASMSRVQQQTRQPQIVPTVETVGEDDYESQFEDEPYVAYEKYSGSRKKSSKPTPKWMTTTTFPPDEDDLYSYNNAVPNYSYGNSQQSPGYKIKNPYNRPHQKEPSQIQAEQPNFQVNDHQQDYEQYQNHQKYQSFHQQHKNPQKQGHKNHLQRQKPQNQRQTHKRQPSSNQPPKKYKSNAQNLEYQNYIREFHQPPEVFDSGSGQHKGKFHSHLQLQSALNRPIPPARKPGNTPQPVKTKKKKGSDEENSDEDTSDTSDEDGSEGDEEQEDDEEGSDEESGSTSGSGESRANLKQTNPPESRKPPPVPASQSVEASEEDESNEAQEKKDGNEEEDSEEEDDEDGENDGKRSYERNDFSKDRGGPGFQIESTTTEKPRKKKPEKISHVTPTKSGFFSTFLNSITSFFKPNGYKKNSNAVDNHKSAQISTKPFPHSDMPNAEWEEEESNEVDDEYYEDSEENSNESTAPAKSDKKKKKIVKSSTTPRPKLPEPVPQLAPDLSATDIPVIIEESSSWATAYKDPTKKLSSRVGYSQEDDSGEEELRDNPVKVHELVVRKRNRLNNLSNYSQSKDTFFRYVSNSEGNMIEKNWYNNAQGKTSQISTKKYNGKGQPKINKITTESTHGSIEDYDSESNETEENDSLPRRRL